MICLQYSYSNDDKQEYFDIRQTKKLIFYKDQYTTNKNEIPRKQMKSYNTYYQPESIQCFNQNKFGLNPKWYCKTDNQNVQIRDYTISCEGKRGPNDFFVLEDSCYIEYNIRFKNGYQNNDQKYQRYQKNFDLFDRFFDNGMFKYNYNELKPIKLTDIQYLVFNDKQKTTSRRNEIYRQLHPLKGNQYKPDQIRCRNIGSDGLKPVWECKSYLPYPYRLQTAQVSCEGWNGPNDDYIVPGSCMVKYKIINQNSERTKKYMDTTDTLIDEDIELLIYAIAFVIFISALIIYCQSKQHKHQRHQKQNHRRKVYVVEESSSSDIPIYQYSTKKRETIIINNVKHKNDEEKETEEQKKKRQTVIADTVIKSSSWSSNQNIDDTIQQIARESQDLEIPNNYPYEKLDSYSNQSNISNPEYDHNFVKDNFRNKIYINDFNIKKKKMKNQNKITTTKYTPFNFIFKFLFEFYSKLYNIFVLAVALINQLPFNGVVSPATSFLPIIFVIAIAVIREILEDIARGQQDKAQNNIEVIASQPDGHIDIIKSKDIIPGQMIIIKQDNECPCDSLLIENCDQNETFISTASIDGETSLKPKIPIFCDHDSARLVTLKGKIYAEDQTTNIQKLSGYAYIEYLNKQGKQKTFEQFSINNVILKGSIIKSKVALVPIYTGQNTKIIKCSQNIKEKKESILEHKFTLLTLYIFILALLILIITAICQYLLFDDSQTIEYYYEPDSLGYAIGKRELQIIIIISYFIPISLLVTLELTRFLQAIELSVDQKMRVKNYNELTNIFQRSTVIRSSQTIDNLIETNIIFSDKTGTLTKNEMVYKQRLNNNLNISEQLDEIQLFLTGLCHEVQIRNDQNSNKLIKQGESPDELALLDQCEKQQLQLIQRDNNYITIKYLSQDVKYKILFTIPFNASYKYMAICLQEQQSDMPITPQQICKPFQPFFVIKGADNVISQITQQDQQYQEQLMSQITLTCTNGFRVLMYGYKQFDQQNIDNIIYQWNKVKILDVTNQERILTQTQIIQNIVYSHCTFVEDRLQDDTQSIIKLLQQNDIKIWMLTGDRTTTAIAIAQSTGICSQFDRVCQFINCTQENIELKLNDVIKTVADNLSVKDRLEFINQISFIKQQNNKNNRHKKLQHNKDYPISNSVIVIDSESLSIIIQNKSLIKQLILSFLYAKTVIATRLSPEQKAQLIQQVKNFNNQIITTAIGDGQNDVSMIKKANIGIGVAGKEGNAASMNSDISIPQLSFLRRLFKQSRCCSQRNSVLIQYSIYKNSMISFITLIFQQFCNFTVQLGMDQMIIMMYNTILTFIVIFVYSITEFDVSFKNFDLYAYIKLYRNKPKIDLKQFCYIMVLSLIQSAIIVETSRFCLQDQPVTTVQLMNSLVCLFTVLVFIPMKSHTWNMTVLIGWILTFIALFLTQLYSNYLPTFGTGGINNYTQMFMPGTMMCCLPAFVYYFWHIFTNRTIEDKFVQAQARCMCIKTDE